MKKFDEQKMTELQKLMCDEYCKFPEQCGSQEALDEHCDSCQMIRLWNFINRKGMTINEDFEQAVKEMEAQNGIQREVINI